MEPLRPSITARRQDKTRPGTSAAPDDNHTGAPEVVQSLSSAVRHNTREANPSTGSGLKNVDYIMKFILVGDSGVGKSCVLHRFIENKFDASSTHTIGVEFGCKALDVSGKHVSLQVWDTAGQERYRCVTRSYYRGAVGALIVYDVTNRESFENAVRWLTEARHYSGRNITCICIGNKSDLKNMRRVSFMEASRFAMDNNILFFETSAMSGEGVERAFVKVIATILTGIDAGTISSSDLVPGKSACVAGARDLSTDRTDTSSGASCLC